MDQTQGPQTRKVLVVDRSTWGTSLEYPHIHEITLVLVCPVCGGPRGEPQLKAFFENDSSHVCHAWLNPCGHVDTYVNVLDESPEGPTVPNNPWIG